MARGREAATEDKVDKGGQRERTSPRASHESAGGPKRPLVVALLGGRASYDAVVTTPTQHERRFPGSGGALYGQATHGWSAALRRQGIRTKLPGLYLAGGTVHPGAGVPMTALSGRLAAQCMSRDLASTAKWKPTATAGGTSTSSATTDSSA